MNAALTQFQANMKRARDLIGIARSLSAQVTPALDVADVLRASIVLGVSALDAFIHELARKGMLEIAAGARPPTDAYHRFSVSLRGVGALIADGGTQWLDDEVRDRHGWLAFQQPDKVAEALRLISAKELWNQVGASMSMNPTDVKARLALIVDRRNKIAHEADLDPSFPGTRWPIDAVLATEALGFLERLGQEIYSVVTTP